MSLHKPGITAPFHGFADDRAGLRIRHPAVHDIDAFVMRIAQKFYRMILIMALQPFSSESDLTDPQAGFSQFSVSHL